MKPDEVGVLFPRSDAEVISDMVRWWKQQSGKPTPLPSPLLPQAPEVYIAKTPSGGIAAKTDEPGTGTDSSIADVNYANCGLYRIDHKSDSDIEVEPLGVTRPVYNLGSTTIPGNLLVLAVRDKAGKFIAVDLAGGGDDECLWGQIIEEGLGSGGGYYAWREMEETDAEGFEVKSGGRTGTLTDGAARCSSLKQAVPLGIVVKLCRGANFTGSGTSNWWFTTPDLDQDVFCIAPADYCAYDSVSYNVPVDWYDAAVTKYSPTQDTWFRKGDCFLKHANGLPLTSGVRYRGHLCGFSICGDPVYTTTDCCDVVGTGTAGGGGDEPGTGTNPDDFDSPPPIISAPCQGKNFALATATTSNSYGPMSWLGIRNLTVGFGGTDTATFSASGDHGGAATLDVFCSGDQYAVVAGSQIGECSNMSDTSLTSTETIVFFSLSPFILIIDVACTYGGGVCGTTTGGYRVTITIP